MTSLNSYSHEKQNFQVEILVEICHVCVCHLGRCVLDIIYRGGYFLRYVLTVS